MICDNLRLAICRRFTIGKRMSLFTSPGVRRTALALFWLMLVFALTMAVLPTPPRMATDRFGDKANHMMAFAVLTALACLAWPMAQRWRIVERLSFLGALIEVLQSIPVLHRDCDIRDWIADTLAILVVAGIVHLIRRGESART
jgi:hypothetical protein